jgi:hypothetical protein
MLRALPLILVFVLLPAFHASAVDDDAGPAKQQNVWFSIYRADDLAGVSADNPLEEVLKRLAKEKKAPLASGDFNRFPVRLDFTTSTFTLKMSIGWRRPPPPKTILALSCSISVTGATPEAKLIDIDQAEVEFAQWNQPCVVFTKSSVPERRLAIVFYAGHSM